MSKDEEPKVQVGVEEHIEFLKGLDPAKMTPGQLRAEWEKQVLVNTRDCCSNCGGKHKLRVIMLVPVEAGGQLTIDNGRVLCRACEMARDAVSRATSNGEARRPVNFWVSRRMYDKIKALNGFRSAGALVRYLMSMYVRDTERFDDLVSWQDVGADVKVNVWVDRQAYATFKVLVNSRGLTVTDSLKALIRLYEEEADSLLKDRAGAH